MQQQLRWCAVFCRAVYIYSYICDILVRFRLYFFERAQFAEEGRPDTVVEVWAHVSRCVACVQFFFFSGGSG